MDKKAFVLQILDTIADARDMAPGLKLLIQNNALDEKAIDTLAWLFRQAAATTQNQKTQKILEKSASIVENIHTKEQEEQEKDLQDLKELEQLFQNVE